MGEDVVIPMNEWYHFLNEGLMSLEQQQQQQQKDSASITENSPSQH